MNASLTTRAIAVGLLLVTGRNAAFCDDKPNVTTVNFNDDVRPIFTEHCTACHGGVKQAGDVSFVYRDKVLPPDGWIVEPGQPDESVLIDRVTSEDADEKMPPPDHGRGLSEDEIATLRRWISAGAQWSEHWAYVAPKPQTAPDTGDSKWPREPVDRFVLDRLTHAGLEPSPDASPERWLRRVTLDLTGLPPTPEQREAFLANYANDSETACSNLVDQLLDSPAFGERWASVWLDQIRYADSKGLGLDGQRQIWKFRDWVIDSLNSDMPYDQFTIKQMAGDLLPEPSIGDIVATAGHRMTQTNEEGGTDDEEFRVAAVLDRVSTTWQTWQGVTFGCVQCHSHPYGPFRHEEFYEFAAFFNNTADCDLDQEWPTLQVPVQTSDYDAASELDRQIRDLQKETWQREYEILANQTIWQPLVDLTASSNTATQLQVERKGDHDEFFTVDTVSRDTQITLQAPLPENLKQLSAIRLTALPLDPETAVRDSEWGFVLSHVSAEMIVPGQENPTPIKLDRLVIDEPEPFYDPQESLNAKSNQGFAAFSRIHYPRQAALVLDSPLDVPAGSRIELKLNHRIFILASFSLLTRRGHLAVTDSDHFQKLVDDQSFQEQQAQLKELNQKRSKIASVATPVLRERPERFKRPMHVFQRGLFLTKDQEVTPNTPDSLPPLPADVPADRLALARWLVSPENPLTARVEVNRIWARLFGIGLVATEEDFGDSGEPPSHPRLLDDLAVRFQNEFQWSRKRLIRELVLSSTYRQSSKIRPELNERDPQNRLLARGPRNRLSAEIVRDQALAFAGLLSEKPFGKPVHPPIPDGVWRPFSGGDKWNTPGVNDDNRYRRSIYTYTKRSIPYPMFAAFDAPSREFCTPRRMNSNTPVQALMMLNDQTFIECSEGLARRMQKSAATPEDQIRQGFIVVTGREPGEADVSDLIELYNSVATDSVAIDSDNEEQSQNENSSTTELTALTTVASVLLNLDEVVTK
ncbi:PSD1 and planctomycete cytochrome C domain-containing protein [Stieleria varia]|uniref:Planctomycete cytochrome C n=1 Tax=Stieleria varia TaxID=2528005 RepID=A0A5C6B9S8_9BACT|nr:PSD1 and planctomycete cytochrome C domain-containing protein [Stieleria varia]TWU08477.1 Planctomycete cytochrome C [Stieleria varia]